MEDMSMLLISNYTVSLLEVPNELSLCLNISECPCRCKGCSEPYLQESIGTPLTIDFLDSLLSKYKKYNLSCICLPQYDFLHELLNLPNCRKQ